jgi:hypothetical protein
MSKKNVEHWKLEELFQNNEIAKLMVRCVLV